MQRARAPRRARDARQRLAAGQGIQKRGFSNVGPPGEGDFRASRLWQLLVVCRRPNERTFAREKSASELKIVWRGARQIRHSAPRPDQVVAFLRPMPTKLSQSPTLAPAFFLIAACWITDKILL